MGVIYIYDIGTMVPYSRLSTSKMIESFQELEFLLPVKSVRIE